MTRSKNGFLLAELATAVFLIAVLMAVTTSIIFACSDHVRAAHNAFLARQITSNHLETLKHLPFDDLHVTSGDGDDFTSPLGTQLKDFAGTVRVEQFNENEALKQITVTVRWNEKRRTRELSLSVLKAKRTP